MTTEDSQSIKRRINVVASAVIIAMTVAVALPQSASAAKIRPPQVPGNIQVPAGNEPFLEGHATGTQNYVCVPQGSGFAYTLFTPEATLFNDSDKQITTHFFSPNPAENGTIRATWQDSKDTSVIWGQVKPGNSSTDAAFVAPGAIAWLLVTRVGSQDGPTGGDTLTGTTFVQRVNTSGGVAPSSGCSSAADIGRQAFVPYTADYIFYKAEERDNRY